MLESAKANLGQVDIRTIEENNLQNKVNNFYNNAASFDTECNKSQEKSVLKLLDKYKEKLFCLLEADWNSSLMVKNGSWCFFRASPLKNATTFTCPSCSKDYKDARVYQDHLQSAHKITETVPKPRVTCRLKHKDQNVVASIQWDQMANHLARVHKISKPSGQHFFRGFESFDNGVTCSVVWRKRGEDDPVPPSEQRSSIGKEVVQKRSAPESKEIPLKKAGATDQDVGNAVALTGTLNQNTEAFIAGSSSQDTEASLAGPSSHSAAASHSEFGETVNNNSELKDVSPKVSCTKNLLPEFMTETDEDFPDTEEMEVEDGAKEDPIIAIEPEKEKSKRVDEVPLEKKVEDGGKEDPIIAIEPETQKSKRVDEVAIENKSDVSDVFCDDDEFERRMLLADDSDGEPEDSDEFTNIRMQNKNLRYKKRLERSSTEMDPSSDPDNQAFIQEFQSFVSKRGISEGNDTFRKSDGVLFRHEDSFLKFQLKKKPGFKLNDLINFENKNELVELKDPVSWIEQFSGPSGNDNPSRQKEKHKSHKQLRDFVSKKLSEADTGSGFKDLWWADKIRNNLDKITKDVNNRGVWTKLETLIQVDFRKKQISRETLAPNNSVNEVKANSVYFASDKYLGREKYNNGNWKKAMDDDDVRDKEYNDFLNFTRHVLVITDRCRQGVYGFSNQDFFNKRRCWFPEDFTTKEFDNIPDSHPIFQEPEDKRPHDSLIIRLAGSGQKIKLKSGTAVTVNKRAEDLLMKCRDLKEILSKKSGKKLGKNLFILAHCHCLQN